MLSADDGTHTTAYDAVVATITDTIQVNVQRTGSTVSLSWLGGTGPYDVLTCPSLSSTSWTTMTTTSATNISLSVATGPPFFRIRGR